MRVIDIGAIHNASRHQAAAEISFHLQMGIRRWTELKLRDVQLGHASNFPPLSQDSLADGSGNLHWR